MSLAYLDLHLFAHKLIISPGEDPQILKENSANWLQKIIEI